ncbi:hypothetical protein ACVWZ6_005177 [Bradyrhizobium sp. GM6.1]
MSDGVAFGIRDGAQLVATAALLPYPGDNAWISMVLVTASHRRRAVSPRGSSTPAWRWRANAA